MRHRSLEKRFRHHLLRVLHRMTAASVGAVLVALCGVGLFAVVLIRQGFPDSKQGRHDVYGGEGPTDENYPRGSRPAGPGAETMHLEPSEKMHEERGS